MRKTVPGAGPRSPEGMSVDLQAHRILRKSSVLRLTGLSSATLYRWMNEGSRPARRGSNLVGWRESAIRDWLESREPAVTAQDEVEA